MSSEVALKPVIQLWYPPQVEHLVEPETNAPQPQRLQRNRRPPDYYRP